MRNSGCLLHISSLPSKYGIGSLGKSSFDFIDFLVSTHQSLWQILPIGHTTYGDSPYQTYSCYAGNPYFIDLDLLISDGLLTLEDVLCCQIETNKVDYDFLYNTRYKVLHLAYSNFIKDDSFVLFCQQNKQWLDDYSLFMAIKELNNGISWQDWPDKLKYREQKELDKFIEDNINTIDFFKFIQYKFSKQYEAVKNYANSHNIGIIGDMPIYVALDSVEAWSSPEVFLLDEELKPTFVAGCPPDEFSKEGQLWGNVLYNWSYLESTNFDFWLKRIDHSFLLYDKLRIDHFIGFENYYAIPYLAKNAIKGTWHKAKGRELFTLLKNIRPNLSIIAEDLGIVTQDVISLLEYTGYPGMKVLQFSFYDKEQPPYVSKDNQVIYTSTHDSETSKQWFSKLKKGIKEKVYYYLNISKKSEEVSSLIKYAFSSNCNTCIIPLQDYLNLGSEARMNVPSTLGNNWAYRLDPNYNNEELRKYISNFAIYYYRDNLINFPKIEEN